MMGNDFLVDAQGVHAWYASSHVLHGVDIQIARGQTMGLLGRNGMGKSTLIRTLLGHVTQREGRITLFGQDASKFKPHQVARLGVAYVPEGRGVFPNLTVRENLVMAARPGRDGQADWSFERVMATFPRLAERLGNLGNQLSGGEQQMLSIGRALMNHPRLLMLDEPVEGLAPVIVEEIVAQLKTIKQTGLPVLLVEQNLEVCTQLADRHYIIEQGRIVYESSNADFIADTAVKDRYLGVGMA